MELQGPRRREPGRVFRRLLIWATGLVVLVIAGSAALLYAYEDDVKSAVIRELNKHLRAEVRVNPENIDLTILSTFPSASVRFTDLVVMEAIPHKVRDTLLFAETVHLHFDLSDLWKGKYGIEKVSIERGFARPAMLKNGKVNYEAWQSDKPSTGSLNFNLNAVRIRKFLIRYRDDLHHFLAESRVTDLTLQGNFTDRSYRLKVAADMQLMQVFSSAGWGLADKRLRADAEFAVSGKEFRIDQAQFLLNEATFGVQGGFRFDSTLTDAKFTLTGKRLTLPALLSLVPSSMNGRLRDYRCDGDADFNGKFAYNDAKDFNLRADFQLSNGMLNYRPGRATLTSLSILGSVSIGPRSQELHLHQVSFLLDGDTCRATASLKNFDDPVLECDVATRLRLSHVAAFYPTESIERLDGTVALSGRLKTRTAILSDKNRWSSIPCQIEGSVNGFGLKIRSRRHALVVPSGEFRLSEGTVAVRSLHIMHAGSDLVVDGRIGGLLNYLADSTQQIAITGQLHSSHIRIEDFIEPTTKRSSANRGRFIPANLQVSVEADIDSLSFGKFIATEISGDLDIQQRKLLLSDVGFKTMNGGVHVTALADNSSNDIALNLQAELEGIDIAELFRQMNNFGQTTLQDRHLRGVTTATVDFASRWNADLDAVTDEVTADCDIRVKGGELNQFAPLASLAKFIDIAELQRVRFEQLTSIVHVRHRVITIGKTSIKNSALNLDVSGTHSFDNAIDYHFRVLLSDLRAKRSRKQSEFGEEIDPHNRRSIFVSATGTVGHPVFHYDRQGLKDKIAEDIRDEKRAVRELLGEEFHVFRKDSVRAKPETSPAIFNFEKSQVEKKKSLEAKKKEEEDDF
jgi:hypothetical protein